MHRNEVKIVALCLFISLTVGGITLFISHSQKKKIVVVDAVKLFEGYTMKMELEGIEKVKLEIESKQMDSIKNLLEMARAVSGREEDARQLDSKYQYLKTKLENDYTQSNHDINEQVWKRLNPVLERYGRENKIEVMLGANGLGSVLYVDKGCDNTEDAIRYVNKKYVEGN